MSKKILAVGPSFVEGFGLEHLKDDPKLWVNQIVKSVYPDAIINNVARRGTSNEWIMLETISNLIENHYDLVIVGWAPIPRFNVHVGLELYDVLDQLNGVNNSNLNNYKTIKGSELKKIGDQLRILHNDHWDLLKMVKYVNIIKEIQVNTRSGKLVFVNTMIKLPTGYFTPRPWDLPSELTEFERNMFSVDTRDDSEIKDLYNMVHNQYKQYHGIQEDLWLNLYEDLWSLMIDTAPHARGHPGYASQDLYKEKFLDKFKILVT